MKFLQVLSPFTGDSANVMAIIISAVVLAVIIYIVIKIINNRGRID